MMANKRTQYRELERTFRVPPFPGRVIVVVTSDIYEAAERRPVVFKDWRPGASWDAYTANLKSGNVMLVLKYVVKPPTIVHECCHAVTSILENAGVEHPFDPEVQAYTLDELFETVTAFVKEARSKRRK
jgi:hypothetical protein